MKHAALLAWMPACEKPSWRIVASHPPRPVRCLFPGCSRIGSSIEGLCICDSLALDSCASTSGVAMGPPPACALAPTDGQAKFGGGVLKYSQHLCELPRRLREKPCVVRPTEVVKQTCVYGPPAACARLGLRHFRNCVFEQPSEQHGSRGATLLFRPMFEFMGGVTHGP